MDVLTDVLESIRARNVLLGRLDLTAPWGLVFDPKPECGLSFFVVSRGSAVFETSDGDVRWLAGGDFVLMCHPTSLTATLRDHPDSPAVPALSVITPAAQQRDCRPGGVFRHGGGGALTNIIGGRIDIDNLAHNPLLRSLPPVVHVRGEQVSPASWLETTLHFGQSLRQLRTPMLVRGQSELALELLARQLERLDLTLAFGIADLADTAFRPFALQFLHPLCNPRLGVDQAFPGVTHRIVSPLRASRGSAISIFWLTLATDGR